MPAATESTAVQIDHLLEQAEERAERGETVAAEQMLQEALQQDPGSARAQTAYGELLAARRRHPDAMEHFEAALLRAPQDTRARAGERTSAVAWALHLRASGEEESALHCLEHARDMLPNDAEILNDLGIEAYDLHHLSLAAQALTTSLAIQPRNGKTLYALARVEAAQGRIREAEAHYKAYLQLTPDDASAHYGLGHLYQMEEQTEAAVAEFHRSLALQPQQTESYFQLGQIALDAHDDAPAEMNFQRTLERWPEHGGALTGMGILAFRKKQYDTAQTYLMRAVAAAPAYQPAHYYLGLTLARTGASGRSQQELQLAQDLAAKQQGKGQPQLQP